MALNFAHRGFSGKYPENTMLAFSKAIDAGCDGIELDVQLTSDGEVVIIHDETVDRTTESRGYVAGYTYSKLKKLDASYKFRGIYGENPIPSFREYCDLLKDKNVVTNVELKTSINPYPGIEEKTLKIIDEFKLRDRIIISSFNHYSVLHMKSLAPDMKYGFLTETCIIDFPAYTAKYGIDFVHPHFKMVTEQFAKDTVSAGVGINTWTVNEESDIREMLSRNVNAIIGNYPDRVGEILKER